MGIEDLIKFLQSPTFYSFTSILTTIQFAGSSVSKIKQLKIQSQKDSHEWQLINCLEHALLETQNSLHWENDSDAIGETFVGALFTFKDKFSEDALAGIFKDALGHEVTKDDINEWIHQFLIQLSRDEHAALREYLKMNRLLFPSNNAHQTSPVGRIITPQAPQWVKDGIICRDELINLLCEELSNEVVHLQLIGMGGIGKTEIINRLYAKFAACLPICFDHIGLFSYNGEIETDLEQQLDYPKQYKGLQGAAAAQRFLQDLCNEKRVLLLVDDIREKQDATSQDHMFLKMLKSLRASVLLASRTPIPSLFTHDVCALNTDACIRIFEKQYGQKVETEEINELTEIIEQKAGSNTLLVNRLGSMARDYTWSICELFDRLEKNNFNISKGIFDDELLQQEINKVYALGENIGMAEKNILEAFSAFPKIPLSQDVCVQWLCADAAVDLDNCRLLLTRLAKKTWLEKHCTVDGKPYFAMHQMVAAAVKTQLKIELLNHETLVKECADSISQYMSQYKLDEASRFLPFEVSIFECLYCEVPSIAQLAKVSGHYYYHIANYIKALEWYQKALNIQEKMLGKEHLDTATTYNNIGAIYHSQGEYLKALEWHHKALGIHEKVLGKEHPNTATTYNKIAGVHHRQAEYLKAMEWYSMALGICEKVLGKEHPDTATTYNGIAAVYDSQGEYPKALEWYQKALSIQEKVLGKEHPNTAILYSNIGGVYDKQGEYPKALEWHHQTLDIREKVLGKEHPDTAATYNNIAGVYDSQGEYPTALEWYQKALNIREKVLGKDHPFTATTYSNIGGVHHHLGEYPKALEWYHKALNIREKVLGKEHPDIANAYNNIAAAYYCQGEYREALECYQKALTICEKVLGKEHPYTATTYNNIAVVYSHQGEYPKALECYQKALDSREKVLGKEHPDTAATYNNIAGVYDNFQSEYPKALEWYHKALDIREKVLGKEHPDTATIYSNIGGVYYNHREYLKALEWYHKALSIREKVLGREHPGTATIYNNIAGVYDSQGKYPKALEWYHKALDIREKVLGREHPDTASTYDNIARVYSRQGEYPSALEWYHKALGIREKVLGNKHPDTAISYNNIGGMYSRKGDYPKALEWYRKALRIFEAKLGVNHPYVTIVLNNINSIKKQ